MDFNDRIIWITGASSGIGAALARAFARAGAVCVLSARRTEELEAVRASCDRPERHHVRPLDVADFATHPAVAADIGKHIGRVDVLVNNAGISQRSRAWDTELAVVRRITDINYIGAVSLTQTVLPGMMKSGSGHIVVISSLTGRISTPGRTAYAASKHALHGYYNGLRAELHGTGVGVTIIAPGYVKTEISINAVRGDGSRNNKMDSQHAKSFSPDVVADRTLKAVRKNKAEVLIGGPERLGVQLFRFAPGIFRALAHRFEPG